MPGCQANPSQINHQIQIDNKIIFDGNGNKLTIDLAIMKIYLNNISEDIYDCSDLNNNCLTNKKDLTIITPKVCRNFNIIKFSEAVKSLKFFGLNPHGAEYVFIDNNYKKFGYSFSTTNGVSEIYDLRNENNNIYYFKNSIERYSLTKMTKAPFFKCIY